MADETQATPVAGAQTATEVKTDDSVKAQEAALKKKYPDLVGFVYMSDPSSSITLWHHKAIPVFDGEDTSLLPWHIHNKRPDDSLVDPVWDDTLQGGLGDWKENATDAQSQILAQAQEKIAELDTKSKELDQKAQQFDQVNDKLADTLKTVQAQQQAGSAQSLALTKAVKQLSDNQADQNKLLASMQQLILKIASGQSAATPIVPKEPTQPTTAPQGTTATQPANN